MAIHRGAYSLPTIEIRSTAVTPPVWPHWVSSILSNPDYVATLHSTGIEEAIHSSCHREAVRCRRDVIRLCCRWVPPVHSLFFAWGEANIIMEDVVTLTVLPVHGLIFIMRRPS